MNGMTQTLTPQSLPWSVRPLISVIERIRLGTLRLTTPEGLTLQFGDGGAPRAAWGYGLRPACVPRRRRWPGCSGLAT